MLNESIAKAIFMICDILMLLVSLLISYMLRDTLSFLSTTHTISFKDYITFFPLYLTPIFLFAYEGIYTRRYDFWQETYSVIKALLWSVLFVFAYLAMTKSIQEYSRLVIGLTFVFATFLIPLSKYFIKRWLWHIGIWKKPAFVYGNDTKLKEEIFHNCYLGYTPSEKNNAKSVFINSSQIDPTSLAKIIDKELTDRQEVIFIPLLNQFDLTKSNVYELSNTRTNLISLQNRLASRYRRLLKSMIDITFSLIALPLLVPLLGIIAYLIKKEEPKSSIFFIQDRLGENGNVFRCYKFRTMYENGDRLLKDYLKEHPEEQKYYDTYHKYKHDPRITRIGSFLRKTSLDELPQIINVLKRDMSLVGPRPYLLSEKEKMATYYQTVIQAKPGITGLWQVSGRSEVDFFQRLQIDSWYIRNWSIWLDIVILFKTIKTVLKKEGAY